MGHTVFCALREDAYIINDTDPAEAYSLDMENIESCDALLALLDTAVSAGTQTEIGVAVALKKKVFLAHLEENKLTYFNAAMLKAGVAQELILPLTNQELEELLSA